jgi:tRNA pseudouridine38-40 synthase
MPRFAIALEYDGTHFAGTQTQAPGLRTLQQVLTDASTKLEDRLCQVRLSSRLDAGVSASALIADISLERVWEPNALGQALSSHLPPDVVARRVAPVPDDWFAKIQAKAKTYHYRVCRRTVRPVLDQRVWWVRRMDYPDRLVEAARLLPGHRDLSGFACLRRDDTDEQDPYRGVLAANWVSETSAGQELHTFRITGEGFLYKQVRGLVGAMVFLAQGNATIADFTAAMAAGRGTRRLGNIAPPTGLCLVETRFDPEPEWVWL